MTTTSRARPALERLGETLWLRPAIAAAAGSALGLGLTAVDLRSPRVLLFVADADQARSALLSIITLTLTVTATVFGFIVVALQLASTQFSPRSLRSFVRDRATQTSLAVFIGVVAYALAVLLRTSDGRPDAPSLAVAVALGLILVVAGTLAFIIHHTAQSVRIEHLMTRITQDTLATIARMDTGSSEGAPPQPPDSARPLPAPRSGYLQGVDLDGLADVAASCHVTIALREVIGEHCIRGLPVGWVWREDGPLDDATERRVVEAAASAVAIGFERTMVQDVAFGPRQLVDIALRAISPAINDPRTAVEATKHLARILCELTPLPLRALVRRAGDGRCLVVLPTPSFDDYLELAVDQIRRFGAGEPAVGSALLVLLERLVQCDLPAERRRSVARHVELVEDAARRAVSQPADLEPVVRRADRVRTMLAGERGVAPADDRTPGHAG